MACCHVPNVGIAKKNIFSFRQLQFQQFDHAFCQNSNSSCFFHSTPFLLFLRNADKGRDGVGIAVADDGVGDIAVGLDGGALLDGGDEQDL